MSNLDFINQLDFYKTDYVDYIMSVYYEDYAMSGCCEDDCSLDRLRERQRGTLHIVLGINSVMFFVIAAAALYGKSTALLADSLDNLGDALTYGLSLYAV